MMRGCAISFVLTLLICLVQCNKQFEFVGAGEYDLHKLPIHNTSGPFLVQVQYQMFYSRVMIVNLIVYM